LKKINDTNLYWLLNKYGLVEAFTQYELKCSNCRKILDENNIGTIQNTETGVQIYCNSTKCKEYLKINSRKIQ